MTNRFKFVGDMKFVGKGRVLDTKTGEEFNADLRFKAATPVFDINYEDRKDVKVNLKLVEDESNTMWEIVVLDHEL
jgi:hypothetical protein